MEENCQNCVLGVKDRAICSECNGTTVVAQTVAEPVETPVVEAPVEQTDAVAERE